MNKKMQDVARKYVFYDKQMSIKIFYFSGNTAV